MLKLASAQMGSYFINESTCMVFTMCNVHVPVHVGNSNQAMYTVLLFTLKQTHLQYMYSAYMYRSPPVLQSEVLQVKVHLSDE